MAVLEINPQKIVAYTQDVLDAIAGIDVTQDVLDVIAGIDVSWNDLTDKPIIAAISDVNAAPTAEDFNALLSALRAAGLMELGDSGTTEDTETTGYFDITSAAGFTMRIYYSEINKIVTITDIKLQSTVYKGMWYPHGAIKVNNITVFEMDYWAPATHVFNVNSAGDSWFDLQV